MMWEGVMTDKPNNYMRLNVSLDYSIGIPCPYPAYDPVSALKNEEVGLSTDCPEAGKVPKREIY